MGMEGAGIFLYAVRMKWEKWRKNIL